MTKAEFLEKLRIELSSGVTPQVLQENLNYYGQYIDDEIRKGKMCIRDSANTLKQERILKEKDTIHVNF